ncbi:MAG TPA: hypothetical protein DEP39_11560, partial [Deltaproteobacteria bacterium]|nr:hypothetical protein [Deltaproteobacteria bacterium]
MQEIKEKHTVAIVGAGLAG